MNKNPESLFSIFLTFLRFGFLAWGGPVAQIAMIYEELVVRQKWIPQEKFRRVLSVYQALPGPEAHELCVYFGMTRKGRWGGFVAGLGFMLPGFFLMLLLSWLYVSIGAKALLPIFIGFAPAIAALIIKAAHKISKNFLYDKFLIIAAIVSVILTLLKVHFIFIFLICALWRLFLISNDKKIAYFLAIFLIIISLTSIGTPALIDVNAVKGNIFLDGAKAGLLSFGGAYTAIPFLQNSMIGNYTQITNQSFIDGLALAIVIPAPLVIFATYLGFLADGFFGAFLITVGIFLPAFLFTLVGHRTLEKIIDNPAWHSLLDGVASGVVGILIVTAAQIFLNSINGILQIFIFIFAIFGFYSCKQKFCVPAILFICGLVGFLIQ